MPIPFIPALYDIKASFAGEKGHLFPSCAESMVKALSVEVEELGLKTVTVAYDIYNVEAEAAGAVLRRDSGLGMPEIEDCLINSLDALSSLPAPCYPAGRMELFVNAAAIAKKKWGATVTIRGAVTGSFSMASKLFPKEELLMEAIMNPEGVRALLGYCNSWIKKYAEQFLKAGCEVAVFDSFIAPPMLSPDLYRDIVFPFHRDLFDYITANGGKKRPLIAGGDTRALLPHLVETGANQLIIDYVVSPEDARQCMNIYPSTIFRYNLDPSFVINSTDVAITEKVTSMAKSFEGVSKWIFGTGILPNGTDKNKIRLIASILSDIC